MYSHFPGLRARRGEVNPVCKGLPTRTLSSLHTWKTGLQTQTISMSTPFVYSRKNCYLQYTALTYLYCTAYKQGDRPLNILVGWQKGWNRKISWIGVSLAEVGSVCKCRSDTFPPFIWKMTLGCLNIHSFTGTGNCFKTDRKAEVGMRNFFLSPQSQFHNFLKKCCSATATPRFRNRNFFLCPQLQVRNFRHIFGRGIHSGFMRKKIKNQR
jgi:hypothetical protein